MPSYEADLKRFEEADTQVLGISVDSIPSHVSWAKSLGGVSYPLLADLVPKGATAKAFGAYRAADRITERALFVIDKARKVAYADIHEISKQPDNEVIHDVLRKL